MSNDAYDVTWLVRQLFRPMAAFADQYLHDAGLTVADRAVLEFLYPDAELSVPDIARRYQASRQHVQVTVNGLVERGLLCGLENPRHKRSPLMCLSDLGRNSFEEIRDRESTLLDALFADVEVADVATTKRTLDALLARLRSGVDL